MVYTVGGPLKNLKCKSELLKKGLYELYAISVEWLSSLTS